MRWSSPRAARCETWSGIAGKPHHSTIVACIGPQTAKTAEEHGLRVDVLAEVSTVAGLVDALAAHGEAMRVSALEIGGVQLAAESASAASAPQGDLMTAASSQGSVPVRTTVHLLRHGEVHNPQKVLYGRLPGYYLSDLGIRWPSARPRPSASTTSCPSSPRPWSVPSRPRRRWPPASGTRSPSTQT
jgi:hypothetical protein